MKLVLPLLAFTLLPASAPAAVLSGFSAFSDDFERGPTGWTTGSDGDPGTAWELGTPIVVGPAGAYSGLNAFGTNIAANHGPNADLWLRSPAIDLSGLPDATLSYFEFRDIEQDFDIGRVSILRAGNQTELAVLETAIAGLSDWAETCHPLPSAALGETIQVAFRFRSDNFQNFAGWYIDDVTITSTVPESGVLSLLGFGTPLGLGRQRAR